MLPFVYKRIAAFSSNRKKLSSLRRSEYPRLCNVTRTAARLMRSSLIRRILKTVSLENRLPQLPRISYPISYPISHR